MNMIRLKKALETRGISQKSCADLLGISEKSFYNKLTSRTDFTYREVRKLKAFLPEYNMDYLMEEDAG